MADIDDIGDDVTPPQPGEPIDADFEPAPQPVYGAKESGKKREKRGGPGWLGVGALSLIAAGVGGAIGVGLDKPADAPSVIDTAALTDSVSEVKQSQAALQRDLNKIERDVGAVETRLQDQMKTLIAGDDEREGLQALVTELDAVSKRLDDAMEDSGGAGNGAGANMAELEALAERLDALESVDVGDDAAPAEVSRAVAGFGTRLDAIEAGQKELQIALEQRVNALETLSDRMTDLEFGGAGTGEGAPAGGGAAVTALKAELKALKDQQAGASAEIEALRAEWSAAAEAPAAATDKAGDSGARETPASAAEDIAKYERWVEELEAKEAEIDARESAAGTKAEAALALSAIESAARRGRSFTSELNELDDAMPGNNVVRQLRGVAREGAPTQADLVASFGPAAAKAKAAVKGDKKGNGWGWVNGLFGDAVTYTSDDESDAGAAELLGKAEAALKDGDLGEAIRLSGNLDGEAKAEMADWIDGAERRKTLDNGLDALRETLTGKAD